MTRTLKLNQEIKGSSGRALMDRIYYHGFEIDESNPDAPEVVVPDTMVNRFRVIIDGINDLYETSYGFTIQGNDAFITD